MVTVNYYKEKFSSYVRTKLEATAFRLLCVHLRERSDDVQNIDLMITSGFCRNCLAKVRTGMNIRHYFYDYLFLRGSICDIFL